MKLKILIILIATAFSYTQYLSLETDQLMPKPLLVKDGKGKFILTPDFNISVNLNSDKLNRYIRRFLFRLDHRTHVYFNKDISKDNAQFSISFKKTESIKIGVDESYQLFVNENKITLNASTDIGIMRGLETLLQLIKMDGVNAYFPAVEITDKPRFKWRGLLIDVSRHWMPVDVIKRNLDGMALVKLNTLHWHLSEDQGFRVESKKFPKLHELGSNGDFYTQEQIKDIIKYANDRGIRVMPEFDIPGHATSWFVGHPELSSKDTTYSIEKRFGVMDPAMNPTSEVTYKFLDTFLTEMSELFNDEYFHIGGDENNGKHWDQNKDIQAFMKKNKIKDNHELQSYFNQRVLKILTKNKKKMVGWDEIFQPNIPKTIVIHSWRGKEAMMTAAKKGYQSILSNGYYIDLVKPAYKHYLNEPIPDKHDLTNEQLENILGGEATMWAELVTPETVDSRIWPRTAAIAERFWSPRDVNDVDDMYRRLSRISLQLENVGLEHIKNQDMMIRRYLGHTNIESFKMFLSLLEPLKIYQRHAQGIKYTTDLSLTRLPDMTLPESMVGRNFNKQIEDFIEKPSKRKLELILEKIETWTKILNRFQKKQKGNTHFHSKLIPHDIKLENYFLKQTLYLNKFSLLLIKKIDSSISYKKIDMSGFNFKKSDPFQETEFVIEESLQKLAYFLNQ